MTKIDLSDYRNSYLYKLHHVTATFDALIDRRLKQDTEVGLGPYVLLHAVRQHRPVTQNQVAQFLKLTPGAVSRQVETAKRCGWLTVHDHEKDRRKQLLEVTPEGHEILKKGDACIRQLVPSIFPTDETRTRYIEDLDALQERLDAITTR